LKHITDTFYPVKAENKTTAPTTTNERRDTANATFPTALQTSAIPNSLNLQSGYAITRSTLLS
jgi:hypothetical protein